MSGAEAARLAEVAVADISRIRKANWTAARERKDASLRAVPAKVLTAAKAMLRDLEITVHDMANRLAMVPSIAWCTDRSAGW